jgi:hypothetical protein
MSRADAAAARHFVRWTPPGPGLVLLLWWPQRPRSAVARALRTRPCHTGTRVRPRLSTPAFFHPMPTAARRPAAAGYRWPAVHPVTPSARPGMTHREERGPCAGELKAPCRVCATCGGHIPRDRPAQNDRFCRAVEPTPGIGGSVWQRSDRYAGQDEESYGEQWAAARGSGVHAEDSAWILSRWRRRDVQQAPGDDL